MHQPPASGASAASAQSGELRWPEPASPEVVSEPLPPERSERTPPAPEPDAQARFRGSMLAGALGDAMGYSVEFRSLDDIRAEHGPLGVRAPVLSEGRALISDDTQMMLFTLEGLIRAHVARRRTPVDNDPVPELQHAYQRWFHTQNQPWENVAGPYGQHLARPDGWLITHRELFAVRAPGNTCLSALDAFARTHRSAGFGHRVNDSKGCGAVMRAAPVAVWSNDPAEVFHAASSIAALTHGHPSGYLPAGVLATVVHQLIRDVPLSEAVLLAVELLRRWPGHEEVLTWVRAAEALAARGAVAPEEITAELGEGWVGEQALAVGLYAAWATADIRDALPLSINHSGDSDSTGIVCGTIIGAMCGDGAVPTEWLARLELVDVLRTVTHDALREFSPRPPSDPDWERKYPAW